MTAKSPAPNEEPFPYNDFAKIGKRLLDAILNRLATYLLLTGDSGTGKTAITARLSKHLDRTRHRLLYFAGTKHLGPSGLIRVLARSVRVSPRRSHAETVQEVARLLAEEPQQTILLIDDAQDIPDETIAEVRSLAESRLEFRALRVVLIGLASLRERLQAIPSLWRRFLVREELTGLTLDEMPAFAKHHFGPAAASLAEPALSLVFERGRGIPGLLIPLLGVALGIGNGGRLVEPAQLDDALQRWELP